MKQVQSKPLIESVKTIGDWIKAQRQQKKLTAGHVALKMGIAHALVLSWEDGNAHPNDKQLENLAQIWGLDVPDALAKTNSLKRPTET